MVGLDEPQRPLEVTGLDRPDKGVDHQPRGAGGITRPAPGPTPRAGPAPLFALFYQVEIRYRQPRRRRGRIVGRDDALGGCREDHPYGTRDIVGFTGLARGESLDR